MPYLAIAILLSLGTMANAKVLKLALDAGPVSQDPQVQLSGRMLQYSHWVFDPLVRFRQDMSFEPRLAEKWERIDDLTMRFHLRKGVKFHSGNPFTAADVKFTFERFYKSPDFKDLFTPFGGCYIVNDHVVDITTKEPYALLIIMATYIFPLDSKFYTGTDGTGQPKDAVAKIGPSFALKNESGTGPFKVTEWEQGAKYVLDRFADYWDKDSPGNVSQIVLTPFKEDATRVAALLSGEVDFIAPVPPQDFQRIREDDKVKLVTWSGNRIITFQLNQKRRAEFEDVRVRQAIVYAVNNVGIAQKIMESTATPAGQLSPKGYMGYNPALEPRYNLKKAKALMKAAGLEKGFECTMIAPNNIYVNDEKIAQATVSMLAKINIKVNLKTMPKAQYWDEFNAQVADIQMIGWQSDIEDSGNFTEFLGMCPNKETGLGQFNSGNYCNPKIDKLAMAAQIETDMKKRTKILQSIEEILYDEAAFVPFHWQNHSYAGKNKVMIDRIVNTMNYPYLGDLEIR
jgi:peptide/nickel transport system substrate-binding protein